MTRMKDIWILTAATAVMIGILLIGRYIRGDYSKETVQYEAVQTELNGLVIEQDGRALINVNMADADMLTRIEGIGPTLAGRIISYREEFGDFISLDELLKVDGIGTKKLEKIKERLFCRP